MRVPNSTRSSPFTVNMTPMIDVTFLLIIFFLVSSHLGKQENNLKLNLPSSQTGIDSGVADQRRTTTVQVLPDGALVLGGQVIEIAPFRKAIAARHSETPGGLRIRIRTDKKVPYSTIAKVLKACTQAGVVDVVFAVYEDKGV
jgi:biopolymer transport protein ExbD